MSSWVACSDIPNLLSGKISFSPDTWVSPKSLFGNSKWDYTDEHNQRRNSVSKSKQILVWDESPSLPEKMVFAVKVFAFLYLYAPASVVPQSSNSTNKPHTVQPTVLAALEFFELLVEKSLIYRSSTADYYAPFFSLRDISIDLIRDTLSEFEVADQKPLKIALKGLASSSVKKICGADSVNWTISDIDNLDFSHCRRRNRYERVYPNALFRLFSDSATADVMAFLRFVGAPVADSSAGALPLSISETTRDGATMFRHYVEIRKTDLAYSMRVGKRQSASKTLRDNFERIYRIKPGTFLKYLRRVHGAACTLVALYTGARFSDLAGFKVGCVQRTAGYPVIVGTEVKHQSDRASIDEDVWPAIPVLQDAVHVLELMTGFTCNEFLLSGLKTVYSGEPALPFSSVGLAEAIRNYLTLIDSSGRWSKTQIGLQRFRHTLAHQLARADVGLVYIAYQLKHLYTALSAVPPQVTLMYGNIANLKLERAMHSEAHYIELARNLYDPTSPVAGGGASDFVLRRKYYFEGLMAQGYSKDEILRDLAKQGLPFASVGLGYCGGKREILNKDGTKEKPPCIGSLQCNPQTCKNALITRVHARVWKKIKDQNLELAEQSEMAYARNELLKNASLAQNVLQTLNGA